MPRGPSQASVCDELGVRLVSLLHHSINAKRHLVINCQVLAAVFDPVADRQDCTV